MDVAEAIYGHGLSVGRPLALDPAPDGFVTCCECRKIARRWNSSQVTCGARACQKRRYKRSAQRRSDYREANKARCARWYAEHREEHIARRCARAKMPTEPHWFIADHAVQQWRARYGKPGDTMAESREALAAELARAHFVKSDDVGEMWRGPKPRKARFVVRRHERTLDLVTVLPPFDGHRRC